jgi:dihydroneopterin aldolase
MIGKFELNGLEFHAFHGVYESEKINGQTFRVDISFETNVSAAAYSDNLEDTLDYTYIYMLISEQMKIRSSLLEHVANRIVSSIKTKVKGIQSIELKITKVNPPIKATIGGISLTLKG